MNLAEAFLQDQIPIPQRAVVPTALRTAYATARVIIENEPIFNQPSAIPQHGRIIQLAVDMAFDKLVVSGQFGLDRRWRDFAKPTGKYLEILFSHSALTISQVADPEKQPRDVQFRANKRTTGQVNMAFMRDEDRDASGRPHILLLHGHRALNFAHLAIPDPIHSLGFQHRSANLMLMAHAVPQIDVPMEDTDIEAVMSLKEDIEKRLRDDEQQ